METIKLSLYIIGGLFTFIGLLLTIIGYWVKGFIQATKTLQNTVSEMNTSLVVQKNRHGDFIKSYNKEQEIMTKRLDAHAKRLDEHDKDLATLKAHQNVQTKSLQTS